MKMTPDPLSALIRARMKMTPDPLSALTLYPRPGQCGLDCVGSCSGNTLWMCLPPTIEEQDQEPPLELQGIPVRIRWIPLFSNTRNRCRKPVKGPVRTGPH